jgi:hypothetical protein
MTSALPIPKALEQIRRAGYLQKFQDSIETHRRAIRKIRATLPTILPSQFVDGARDEDSLAIFQDHFFLVLFDAVYRALGVPEERCELYASLNQYIRGVS